ncbi:His/Gly/Thr/Pro-type tRNA ligase C-terminal domain-containing protein [Sulfobacillus harzensis]|uniref:Anticodon-binding domain-containing protein n=1 Tax=Sulfobacillus harzensis TaxID=2729629 RepID=A0A7Y0L731_9FIRM|nr:hypothetical protein [Sulfobacillus harzensis]
MLICPTTAYSYRDVPAGVKFHDADLLGLPYRLTISPKTVQSHSIEWKQRRSGDRHRSDPLECAG